MKKGDIVTVEKWVKKLGKIIMPGEDKPRNALSMLKKGLVVAAKQVTEDEQWDTVVSMNNQKALFKRLYKNDNVIYDEDIVVLIPKKTWEKATTTNLFLNQRREKNE